MSEIIRELREYADGNPASYPFGALAENIILSDGSVLEDALGNVNLFENGSVIEQIQKVSESIAGRQIVEKNKAEVIGNLNFIEGNTTIGSVGKDGLSKINIIGGVNGSRWQNDLYLIDGSGIGGFIKPDGAHQQLQYNAGASHIFKIGNTSPLKIENNKITLSAPLEGSTATFSSITSPTIDGTTGIFKTLTYDNIVAGKNAIPLSKSISFSSFATQAAFARDSEKMPVQVPYLCYYTAPYFGYLRTKYNQKSTGITSQWGKKGETKAAVLARYSQVCIGICCKLSAGGENLRNSIVSLILLTESNLVYGHRFAITRNAQNFITKIESTLKDASGKDVFSITQSYNQPW